MQLMPMITEGILHVGESGMGILMSVSGAGAIVGSVILASVPSRKRGVIMIISGCVMGLALVGFAFSRWWALSLVMVIFVGLGQTSNRTSGNALRNLYRAGVPRPVMVPDDGAGIFQPGDFLCGHPGRCHRRQWAIGGLAIALVIMSIILATTTKRLRQLE
jgi:hypothetical protein